MIGAETQVAQLASKIASEAGKQGINTQSLPQGGESPFMNLLQEHESKMNGVNTETLKAFGYETNTHPADNAVSAKQLEIKINTTAEIDATQPTNKAANLMTQLNRGGLQMDKIMEMVTSGTQFSNREMLLLQGAMHQLTFEAEMAVRSMDAFKTVVQTMVQRTTQ